MPEHDKLLDFLKDPNIFDLDLIHNGLIAGTRIETLYEMRPMIVELLDLEISVTRHPRVVSEREKRDLYDKFPMLEPLTSAPRIGNPFAEALTGWKVWKRAQLQLHLPASDKEQEATGPLNGLDVCMSAREFSYLPPRPAGDSTEIFYLTRLALDRIWEMTQRMKDRPLTDAQEADRKRLERFVEAEVRSVLIALEYEDVVRRKNRAGLNDDWCRYIVEEDTREATRTVDERIARGEWQGPGPHVFKFNGIES